MIEWISVEDRLPEIGVICAIFRGERCTSRSYAGYLARKKVWVCYFDSVGKKPTSDKCGSLEVTHWMPLPEKQ